MDLPSGDAANAAGASQPDGVSAASAESEGQAKEPIQKESIARERILFMMAATWWVISPFNATRFGRRRAIITPVRLPHRIHATQRGHAKQLGHWAGAFVPLSKFSECCIRWVVNPSGRIGFTSDSRYAAGMEPLSNVQIRSFKAQAQRMKATLKVGKDGLSPAFIAALDESLKHQELIKVKFDEFKDEKKTLAPRLAEATGSHLVTRVGNVAVLYRPKPAEQR